VRVSILPQRAHALALVQVLTPRAHANSRRFIPHRVRASPQASRQYRVLALEVVVVDVRRVRRARGRRHGVSTARVRRARVRSTRAGLNFRDRTSASGRSIDRSSARAIDRIASCAPRW
jgi:hypothetical protein